MSERALAWMQGSYYLASGVWPLVSMRTFEAVTGRKTDHWLVNTVGVLVGAVGAALIVSAGRGGPSRDLQGAAAGAAVALAGIDTYYSARGRISKVYLLDAAAETALAAAWIRSMAGDRRYPTAEVPPVEVPAEA